MTHQSQLPSSIPEQLRTSGLAIVSLVMGIATWVVIPLIGAMIAVVTGHLAKKEIRANTGRLTGAELATAGLVGC